MKPLRSVKTVWKKPECFCFPLVIFCANIRERNAELLYVVYFREHKTLTKNLPFARYTAELRKETQIIR
jgi:hypothetical protein